jgi:hypothetical protein
MKWYVKGCPVCGGDLHDDLEDRGWVTCFMCARSFMAPQVLGHSEPGRQNRLGAELEPSLAGPRSSAADRTAKRAA